MHCIPLSNYQSTFYSMVIVLLEAVSFFLNSRFILTLHFFEFAFRFFSFVLDILIYYSNSNI